uniref:non-specific serine/threonine protein kinase n=1 Tax=Spongospora subterranea TaxID=70186 RepID=A0A0H5QNN6_9EUKA|eukprot:CRZ03770.1 hypothetical protein [Spongospora subterranea]
MARLLGAVCNRVASHFGDSDISTRAHTEMRLLRHLQGKVVNGAVSSLPDKQLFAMAALNEIVANNTLNFVDGRDQLLVDGLVEFIIHKGVDISKSLSVRIACQLCLQRPLHCKPHFQTIVGFVFALFSNESIESLSAEEISLIHDMVRSSKQLWSEHPRFALQSLELFAQRVLQNPCSQDTVSSIGMFHSVLVGVDNPPIYAATMCSFLESIASSPAAWNSQILFTATKELSEFIETSGQDLEVFSCLLRITFRRLSERLAFKSKRTVLNLTSQCSSILTLLVNLRGVTVELVREAFALLGNDFLAEAHEPAICKLLATALSSLSSDAMSMVCSELLSQILSGNHIFPHSQRLFLLRVIIKSEWNLAFMLSSWLISGKCIDDFVILNFLLHNILRHESDRFPEETQLQVLATSLLRSSFAPAFFPAFFSSWLQKLSHIASKFWDDIGESLTRLSKNRSETLRQSVFECFTRLGRVPWGSFISLRTRVLWHRIHSAPDDCAVEFAAKDLLVSVSVYSPEDTYLSSSCFGEIQIKVLRDRLQSHNVLSGQEYIIALDEILSADRYNNDYETMQCLTIDVSKTLVHDKLRTTGKPVQTLEHLCQNVLNCLDPYPAVLMMSVFFHLRRLTAIAALQSLVVPSPFPSVAPFFISNRAVCESFFDRMQPHLLRLTMSIPFSIQRAEYLQDVMHFDPGAVVLPLASALRQARLMTGDIPALSIWLKTHQINVSQTVNDLLMGLHFQSISRMEDAATAYADAIRTATDLEHIDLAWSGIADCSHALRQWDLVDVSTDSLLNAPTANSFIHMLSIRSSQLLDQGNVESSASLLECHWEELQAELLKASEPSLIQRHCQLWCTRIRAVGYNALSDETRSDLQKFIYFSNQTSTLCCSAFEMQNIIAYHQILQSFIAGRDACFNVLSPAPLHILSELHACFPRLSILADLLKCARVHNNHRMTAKLSSLALSCSDITLELRFQVFSITETSCSSHTPELWDLLHNSSHLGCHLLMLDSASEECMRTDEIFCNNNFESVVDLQEYIFTTSTVLRNSSYFARWCADVADVRSPGWLNAIREIAHQKKPANASKLFQMIAEVMHMFLPTSESEAIDSAFAAINAELCNGVGPMDEQKIRNIVSRSLGMEIDWDQFESGSRLLNQIASLASRSYELFQRASQLIVSSLCDQYSYHDALFAVALIDRGFVTHNCFPPAITWVDVVPQLLAILHRPDHSESQANYVRQLLFQVACNTDYAENVIIPVSATDAPASLIPLLNSLKETRPELCSQISRFSQSVRECSVFLEDVWIETLPHLISEIPLRWRWWIEECVGGQPFADAYLRVMSSVLSSFQDLFDLSSSVSVCLHNRVFQRRYRHAMQSVMSILNLPLKLAPEYIESKLLLSSLIHQLKGMHQEMHQLSEVLITNASPSFTSVPSPAVFRIPGMPVGAQLAGLSRPSLEILKTKTRPKSITFRGTDGCLYTYLLKGREDLNIDQRVLQISAYVNHCLSDGSNSTGVHCLPPAYTVTTISSQCGMIHMIDDAVSLFRLHRFGQAAIHRGAAGSQGYPDEEQQDIAESTPAQIFTSKLHEKLQSLNLPISLPRREWPTGLADELYETLLASTDDSVLETQLALTSVSAEDNFHKRCTFTSTMASSSVIGYILGVGDRHLGNILVKLETGELIHIDFAVCFEGGLSLRVPETVPFRLTPSLCRALGPLALLNGEFIRLMERVFSICRNQRVHILTILQSFRNNPLFEWSHPRSSKILRRSADRLMIHALLIERLQRSRLQIEHLHSWALGNQSPWLRYVSSLSEHLLSEHGIRKKTAELAAVKIEISNAEKSIIELPDIIEKINRVNEMRKKVATVEGSNSCSVKKPPTGLLQQQNNAKVLIQKLPSLRAQAQSLKSDLDALESLENRKMLPELPPEDLQIISSLQSLWTASIRPLLQRLCRYDSPAAQQLRIDWEKLHDSISGVLSQNGEWNLSVADGRQLFSALFAGLKTFIKSSEIPSEMRNASSAAEAALKGVEMKLECGDDMTVTKRVKEATNKHNLAIMFEGWAAWI